METHQVNSSSSALKQFQIEGNWAPVTPIKPSLTRPTYHHGSGGLLPPPYLREISIQNQPQSLLSCSINSPEIRSNPNGINNYWDAQNSPSIGSTILRRENVGELGSLAQGALSSPGPISWDLPLPMNDGVRENVGQFDTSYDESFAQFNGMSFGDLLALKDSVLDSSVVSTRLGNNGGGMKSTLNPTWAPQTLEYQDMTFCGLNLLSNGVRGGEMQNGAFTRLCNANSSPSIQQSKGKVSTFVPLTPDLRWRVDSTAASAGKTLETDQTPHKQNNKDEAAAVQTNLPEINNKEVLGSLAESSPGNADIVGEENHNLDKVGEQGIDLNKMPQKKPRRKRYTPKVVNENKPKRTPKPSTSKPTESKEATTKVKRKYVRKNKTNPSSMATPAEATDKTDPKPKGVVKSCRRSLNFDLNGQEAENDSLLVSEPQAKYNAVGNQSSHSVHIGQGEGSTVEASQVGIACDLNHTLHREPKNNISLAAIDNLEGLCHDQAIPAGGKEVTVGSLSGSNAEVSSRTGTLPVQRPNSSSCASSREGVQIRGSKREHSSIRDLTYIDTGNMAAYNCTFWPLNPTSLGCINNHGVPSIAIPEVCKKKRTGNGQSSHPSSSSSVAASKNVSQVHSTVNHPGVNPSTSKYYYSNPATFGGNAVAINQAAIIMRNAQNRMQLLNTWADITRLKKKKRLKGATRGRDMSEMKGIASIAPATPAAKCPRISMVETPSKPYPYPYSCSSNHTNQSQTVHSSMEALTGETHTTPRSKRGARKQSSSMRSTKHWDIVLYDGKQSVRKTAGNRYPESKVSFTNISGRWINSFSLEAITEGLKHLDINREGSEVSRREQNAIVPYDMNNREKNAIVPYKQDGTIVPFEGPFEPLKKRRQRAKVDLDDETTKVWRLLLENIDNQGINGTDEEKVKWWENERSVFQGRVDSFIARMRLVQGDRRFTPWKGSVLDSVIGVFLTQNVSDHLSSSAFMSLVARFPVKFECNESTFPEEEMSAVVVEPEVIVVEPEESITWKEKASDPPVCNGNSRIIHEIDCGEEKEAVNSNEQVGSGTESVFPTEYSCESTQKGITESRVNKANSPTTDTEGASILGDDKARDDATSSQQSVISFQNSISSPNLQTLGFLTASPETNSRAQASIMSSQCYDFEHSTSFIGLLKMAESPLLHESYGQLPRQDRLENTEAPSTSSNVYQSHLQMDFHLRATKYIDMLDAESRSSETSRKDENSPIEQSNLTTESTIKHLGKEKTCDGIRRASAEKISSSYVLEGEKMVVHSQEQSMKTQLDHVASSAKEITSLAWKTPTVPNAPQETADVVESSTGFVRTNEYQKETEQTSNHSGASTGVIDVPTPNPSKSKSRAAKEKRSDYDWDSLRREALANGKIKERTANTRDSLDWEALRSADVSEIADTIKARGMNNMLAQRIKDLLDRLVREHGSCDLEWLRDIPPDKAKEYLLSFRGLGLKSVECVRLLTLHHLAFPVDTNVGRIAVRLGWVPLQPLPESLQLHLLEMYPVLESIQKYLWPRLCRLDQKTLYELHYHLITFGKVFCTKRQPNCNACPLRGECRHFASAFASARLALPGPEERSIMPSNGDTQTGLHPQANFNPLPLPPFLGSQHPEEKSRSNIDASVIGVPSAPLSLPLPSNHSEKKSEIKSCEPIVEVPASPEPETDPEQEQTLCDIEDTFYEDPDEIPMIKLNMKQFSQTLENFMQANREVQVAEMSKALVALTPDAASIPTPKLKNISRLRTEHHVYELPDTHPLLKGLDKREPDDPCSYLLAIWTPGETANSIEPPERRCSFEDPSMLCNEVTCSYCSSQREANSQIVRGTLLIPCRTAMRGSFPLNGTYFQVNEVFADHDSSMKPMEVPRSWLWNLPRRTVYFGTSVPTIFRGLNTEEIQHCFWRGYVCVRGFDKKTRSPRPLMARLHFPASKMPRGAKGKAYGDDE